MRWPDALLAISTAAAADTTLVSLFGSSIRMKGQTTHVVPGIEYMLISNVIDEVMEPMVVQWDIFASTLDALGQAETALMRLFDHETDVSIAGVAMLCSYIDGVALDAPNMDNIYARAIRFQYELVRTALQRS